MRIGSLLKRDLCPDPHRRTQEAPLSFHGPFLHVTACLEKGGLVRRNRWCLLFVTSSSLIIMPVPQTALSENSRVLRQGNGDIPGRLESLAHQYRDADPGTVFTAEPGSGEIPLASVTGIRLTWLRRSTILFPLGMYPAEPANARYGVSCELALVVAKKRTVLIAPFSLEFRKTLRDLLGDRVREIPDECPPLL